MPSLDPTILKRAKSWLDPSLYDEEVRKAVQQLLLDPEQLTDAFFTDLSFGTGGLRGVMGVGSNRMNLYTVRKATQGVANYIQKQGAPSKGVVIGFDSRHNSREFAQASSEVLAGNGIPVFLLKELRPTPYLSFACRYLNTQAAIMITASHNSKEYNGYKVYWEDGGQIVAPHDQGIMCEIEKISSPLQVKHGSGALISTPDNSLDIAYLEAVAQSLKSLSLLPLREDHNLHLVYTSLHGTGITLFTKLLHHCHFPPTSLVTSQIIPDGEFPTVRFPNPEYPETLRLGIDQLLKEKGDLLLATDPDADRVGVVVRHKEEAHILTGNQLAALGAYFICSTLSDQKKLPHMSEIVFSLVTTELIKKIAAFFGVRCCEVLTGFKYIGAKITQWEKDGNATTFLFGAEESYGYLIGTHARDKDRFAAALLFAQTASFMKQKGKSLVDLLYQIYEQFGVYRETQFSITFHPGSKGADALRSLMRRLRNAPPSSIGRKVVQIEDYLKGTILDFPPSDLLLFRLEDQSKIVIRPSGTEPKLKVYLSAHLEKVSSVQQTIATCDHHLQSLVKNVQELLKTS